MQGKISDFSIPDIFQLVSSQGKSGALAIRSADERETVFLFSDGQIVDVQSDRREPASMLGTMLVDAGFLTQEELRRHLAAQDKGRRKLGEELIGKGKITLDTLSRFLYLQIKESVFDVLQLKEGDYRFETFAVRPPAWNKSLIRPDVLMMEGMQFLDEYPLLRAKFPPEEFHVRRRKGEKVDAAMLDEVERGVWKVIDFSVEPRRVFRKAGLTWFEGMKGLASLLERGLVEVFAAGADRGEQGRAALREELGRIRRLAWETTVLWGVAALATAAWIYHALLSGEAVAGFGVWTIFF